ncbi:MAG: SMC-Scp complex subunit ScpB [Calditrichaeota bacterium]|nr:SMC-Scp complex subunit ScpB [Calditrichota bacterium]
MDNQKVSRAPCENERNSLARIIEALIFAAPEPVNEERLAEIIGQTSSSEVSAAIDRLDAEYASQGRAFHIIRGGGGFRFATLPEYGRWVRKLVVGSGRVRLTRAALETLSLIAYRQPLTKSEIEDVRGVDSTGVLKMLLERRLVKISGRRSSAGRPLLYGTTVDFLKHFGLDSLDDLPKPAEVKEVASLGQSKVQSQFFEVEENQHIT